MSAPVQVLLFDLGRVVVDIDFERAFAHWAPHSRHAPAALRELFQFDEPYQRHETGHLEADAYFAHLRELLALECDEATLRAGWNTILVAPIPPTLALIDQVRGRLPCHAISNTNAVHLAHMRSAFPGMLERFEHVFASNEIGHRKPHPEAFRHVVRAVGVQPQQALLFDDLPSNIDGARACGLQAVLVRGPEDVRQALLERGLLA
jgi:putative hydrolase of the HAD superfamily